MTLFEKDFLDALNLFIKELRIYIVSLLIENFGDKWSEKFCEALSIDQQKHWNDNINRGLSPEDLIDFHYLKPFALKYKYLLQPQFGKKTKNLPSWFDEIADVRHQLTHFTTHNLKELDTQKGWIHMIYIAQILKMELLKNELELLENKGKRNHKEKTAADFIEEKRDNVHQGKKETGEKSEAHGKTKEHKIDFDTYSASEIEYMTLVIKSKISGLSSLDLQMLRDNTENIIFSDPEIWEKVKAILELPKDKIVGIIGIWGDDWSKNSTRKNLQKMGKACLITLTEAMKIKRLNVSETIELIEIADRIKKLSSQYIRRIKERLKSIPEFESNDYIVDAREVMQLLGHSIEKIIAGITLWENWTKYPIEKKLHHLGKSYLNLFTKAIKIAEIKSEVSIFSPLTKNVKVDFYMIPNIAITSTWIKIQDDKIIIDNLSSKIIFDFEKKTISEIYSSFFKPNRIIDYKKTIKECLEYNSRNRTDLSYVANNLITSKFEVFDFLLKEKEIGKYKMEFSIGHHFVRHKTFSVEINDNFSKQQIENIYVFSVYLAAYIAEKDVNEIKDINLLNTVGEKKKIYWHLTSEDFI